MVANKLSFSALKSAVLAIVESIPANKVMFYGQIADMVGTTPRVAGFIMTGLTAAESASVPWYRVVSKNGYISSLKLGERGLRQLALLKSEGYCLMNDKVDMNKHLWLFAGINHRENDVQAYAPFVDSLKR